MRSSVNSNELINEFHTGLRTFVRSRVSNPADAEDVLQDILMKLHQSAQSVEDSDRVAGWVFRVARNSVTDFYRKSARDRGEALVSEPAADDDPTIDESAEAELAYCVRPFVESLENPYRDAVMMVDIEGLTHAAAAKRSGVEVSTMKSRVQRGRKQLRGSIEECCYVEQDVRGNVVDYEPKTCEC